jgi:MFS family permease
LYSFLQYLVSPVIGALSDVYGRRPLLLICMAGETVAYCIWAMSSNFTIFVMARIVGGITNGNVSLCTAIVTDVSTIKTRGKGMALIGVAFSVGFIVGPITGAMFSIWAKSQTGQFYIVPALLALVLAIINVIYLALYFEETLPASKRAKSIGNGLHRAYNFICPSSLFGFNAVQNMSKKDIAPLQQVGIIYFSYLFLYSGLEYTLTFLTHIRFHFSSVQQGMMFLFVGVVMATVQGGYVRRIPSGSDRRVALTGLVIIIPSFVIIGLASTVTFMYVGLALYSFASASVVPCLTTLASSYGSYDQKGTVMGIFRSLGSLARALGPVLASTVYWSLGPTISYIVGGVLLVIPLTALYRSKV